MAKQDKSLLVFSFKMTDSQKIVFESSKKEIRNDCDEAKRLFACR